MVLKFFTYTLARSCTATGQTRICEQRGSLIPDNLKVRNTSFVKVALVF